MCIHGTGSGRVHSQTATHNKVALTNQGVHAGTGMNQIMTPLPVIMVQANTLALRDTAPRSRH